mmetsp:Transcript_37314/g.67103  ORF Transcript_37314/g.67103 Transcript_37314/m.67103 type:complete len:232 (-) Transcript_37314:54-749(-)
MKVFASIVILASACSAFSTSQTNSNALSRRNFFNGVASASVATAVAFSQPPAAMATDAPSINGIYSDPNHKAGYRVVRSVNKSTAAVTLQDEPKGPIISVGGKIKTSKKGTTITLDLSPKGGPKDVVATLSGNDQLVFPDGNAWTKNGGADGIYLDSNHPKGYRVVRVKGSKVFLTLQDDPKGDVIEIEGKKKGKNTLLIDFSSKGGPKNLAATVEDGKLVFPDGNSWLKL